MTRGKDTPRRECTEDSEARHDGTKGPDLISNPHGDLLQFRFGGIALEAGLVVFGTVAIDIDLEVDGLPDMRGMETGVMVVGVEGVRPAWRVRLGRGVG